MPLLTFLSSSLNVELVYIILKSITKLAQVDRNGKIADKPDFEIQISQDHGDAQFELSKIKIKNYESWSQTASQHGTHEADTLTINEKVNVTSYSFAAFKETFKAIFEKQVEIY